MSPFQQCAKSSLSSKFSHEFHLNHQQLQGDNHGSFKKALFKFDNRRTSNAHAGFANEKKIHWDKTVNVVIIGSGGAGLATAVSAAEHGVKDIVVLEKLAFLGGNTAIATGAFNTSDPKQKEQGIKDSPELHAEQTLKGGDFRANPTLVREMTENSYETLKWLENKGVRFQPKILQVYGALWPRSHATEASKGSDYIRVLSTEAKKLGVEILTQARVVDIIREKPLSGRVLGLE